jgi:TolB protein
MTEMLDKAFKQASGLPERDQDELAAFILAELADDRRCTACSRHTKDPTSQKEKDMKQNRFFFTVLLMLSVIVSGCGPSAEQATLQDSGKIAFASDRDGNFEIYVMNADGSDQTRLTTNEWGDWYPAWSR